MTDNQEQDKTSAKTLPAFDWRGKWQGPLFLVGLVTCVLAAWLWLAAVPEVTWQDRYDAIVARTKAVADGDYTEVEAAAQALLDPKITGEDEKHLRAYVYDLLGDIRWRSIEYTGNRSEGQLKALRDYYQRALNNGLKPTPDIVERLGVAYEGLGDIARAVKRYEEAAAMDPSRKARLARRAIELRRRREELRGEELLDRLIEFLHADQIASEDFNWAVQHAVSLLLETGRPDRARKLVQELQGREEFHPFAAELTYQLARAQAGLGLIRQADDMLVQLKVPTSTPLYAKVNLLRGDLIWRDNPIDSERAYTNVLQHAPQTPMATAAAAGLARSYAAMGAHDKALSQYETAVTALLDRPDNPFIELDDMRKALAENRVALLALGDPDRALRFIQAEGKLFDVPSAGFTVSQRLEMLFRLAETHLAVVNKAEAELAAARAELAEQAKQDLLRGQQVDNLKAAGEALLVRADLAETNDLGIYGQSLWMAASAFRRAGLRHRTIETLEAFIAGRPTDDRVPEARFLLGQALQAAGRYDDAIEVYAENLQVSRPPGRHAMGVAGLIPMAQCYVMKGEAFCQKAEEILVSVVSGERPVIAPDSEQFHSALYELGRLYYQQGKWADAIKKLDEAIGRSKGKLLPLIEANAPMERTRYRRATGGRYLMADSYQRSAGELAKRAKDESNLQRRRELQKEVTARLVQADQIHAQVIERTEALGDEQTARDMAYRRNSYFQRGDCMYELGRYEDALHRYEEGIFRFQTHPAAIGGLVAKYNCYMCLGRVADAEAELARARTLRKHIDKSKVAHPDLQIDLAQWDYWLQTAEKLDPVIAKDTP